MSTNLPQFTNKEYEYATSDDSFIIRGLQINELVDYVNDSIGDRRIDDTDAGDAQSIVVGSTLTDAVIFIKYYATNGTLHNGGEIRIVNKGASLSWTRAHSGDDTSLAFGTSISGTSILLTITADIGGGTIKFSYQKQIINKIS